jgi:hypothetical protein
MFGMLARDDIWFRQAVIFFFRRIPQQNDAQRRQHLRSTFPSERPQYVRKMRQQVVAGETQGPHSGKWAKEHQPQRAAFLLPRSKIKIIPADFETFYMREEGRTLGANPF